MSQSVEIQNFPSQLAQVVEEVFQDPPSLEIVLKRMELEVENGRPDLAYEAAGVVVPLQDIKLEELPPGVQYDENDYAVPDFSDQASSAAAQAKEIFDRVGSICFGDKPDIVRIYAHDGRHTFKTGDLPNLLAFLTERGYKHESASSQGALVQPKIPLAKTGVFPVNVAEIQYDTSDYIGSVPKIDIIRQMARQAREAAYAAATQPAEQVAPEPNRAKLRPGPFTATEQLLALGRILNDTTIVRHQDGRIEERTLRAALLAKYDLSEAEVNIAYNKVLAVEHHHNLLADSAEERTAAAEALQADKAFDRITSKVVNTALREFIATSPSDKDSDNRSVTSTVEEVILSAAARASAPVRANDVRFAKLLVGNEETESALTLCVTDEMAPLRTAPPPTAPAQAEAVSEPIAEKATQDWIAQATKPQRLLQAVRKGFKALGRRLSNGVRSFVGEYA